MLPAYTAQMDGPVITVVTGDRRVVLDLRTATTLETDDGCVTHVFDEWVVKRSTVYTSERRATWHASQLYARDLVRDGLPVVQSSLLDNNVDTLAQLMPRVDGTLEELLLAGLSRTLCGDLVATVLRCVDSMYRHHGLTYARLTPADVAYTVSTGQGGRRLRVLLGATEAIEPVYSSSASTAHPRKVAECLAAFVLMCYTPVHTLPRLYTYFPRQPAGADDVDRYVDGVCDPYIRSHLRTAFAGTTDATPSTPKLQTYLDALIGSSGYVCRPPLKQQRPCPQTFQKRRRLLSTRAPPSQAELDKCWELYDLAQ
jgi:hypothetical protein